MPGQIFPALGAPFVGAGARIIASPFQFVGDADTYLRVVSSCSVAGVVLAVQGRRLDQAGNLMAITEVHTPASNRSIVVSEYQLGEGALLNLTVFATSGAPLVGQCYVMVQLLRSTGVTAIVLGTLLGGYVTRTQALGFPGSPVVSSTEGEPAIRQVSTSDPPAGAEQVIVVPTGARWEPQALFVPFVTSAVVANRVPVFQFFNGATVCEVWPLPFITAGTTALISLAAGVPHDAIVLPGRFNAAMPQGIRLFSGAQIFTITVNMDPGDNYGPMNVSVREWLEVP
jgi:hypothetical protein